MKLSVITYSYSKISGLSDFDCIDLASEQGFDGIEFCGLRLADGEDPIEHALALRDCCAQKGLEVVSYTVGGDLIGGCSGDLEQEIDRLKKEVDVAAALGAKLMRHDCAYGYPDERKSYMGFESALPRIIEGASRVTAYAATRGVQTMTENHGRFCQESQRVERIIQGVNDPNFGALIDMGNFMCADEDCAAAFGRMLPYVKHVHAKDFLVKDGSGFIPAGGFFATRGGNYLRGTIVGHGAVPVLRCVRMLAEAGYDGYISVEFEGAEPAREAVALGRENLAAMIKLVTG